ncbi:helix-turn-helix domain-containing protein [Deinococcus sp. NW-56]|uniref:helix-turn-helix domain-containing protein n=1 Tax=Deinococcus sp. NW-56 TaxID=2080419 RepID=UPI000CF4B006
MELPTESRYISVAYAARHFGVSPQTIRRAIKVGRLESVRVGRLLRLPRSVLSLMSI